ncbi:hypothetical protein Nepgr_012442 [Nepenthes gracilis]|uniref:Uncharacterized protein n=1 Tax=Nepenthes gracilis TaxID=150966 RepID=A0AAD3SHI8_NEPGR|nr:hypothetical protein Nepgr_012442 [Nepenthes gracilis]
METWSADGKNLFYPLMWKDGLLMRLDLLMQGMLWFVVDLGRLAYAEVLQLIWGSNCPGRDAVGHECFKRYLLWDLILLDLQMEVVLRLDSCSNPYHV